MKIYLVGGAVRDKLLGLEPKENDWVVVSIFVNPTQFDDPADLKKYPKTLDNDLLLLNSVSEKIIVFSPEASELYHQNISSKKYHF